MALNESQMNEILDSFTTGSIITQQSMENLINGIGSPMFTQVWHTSPFEGLDLYVGIAGVNCVVTAYGERTSGTYGYWPGGSHLIDFSTLPNFPVSMIPSDIIAAPFFVYNTVSGYQLQKTYDGIVTVDNGYLTVETTFEGDSTHSIPPGAFVLFGPGSSTGASGDGMCFNLAFNLKNPSNVAAYADLSFSVIAPAADV